MTVVENVFTNKFGYSTYRIWILIYSEISMTLGSNLQHKYVMRIMLYFFSTQIMICSLLPRPRYPHLEYYFKKTSKELHLLCKNYQCSKFIDFTSLFVNAYGKTLDHLFCDGIHFSSAGVETFSSHLVGQIIRK